MPHLRRVTYTSGLLGGVALIGVLASSAWASGGDTPAAPASATAAAPTATPKPADPLLAGFETPPNSAKPRVWWHWMNGNVTEPGIVADLEWMNRVGIGGAHYFDAGSILADYKFIEPRLVVGDPNWRKAVNLAARTADRLGMELTTAASPGWSETGGPWVTPAQAQKKYVWSETLLQGGRRFNGVLATPPRVTGGFQNAGRTGGFAPVGPNEVNPEFYADAMVVAYRLPAVEDPTARPVSVVADSGALDVARLYDGDVATTQEVTGGKGTKAVRIVLSYARPITVRGLSLGITGEDFAAPALPTLEVSDDGKVWRPGATLRGPADAVLRTYGFAPLTAKHFRLSMPWPKQAPVYIGPTPPAPSGPPKFKLSELTLQTAGTVDRFVEKAGFSEPILYDTAPTAAVDPAAAIKSSDVIDLTNRMTSGGKLDWTPPHGRWRVIRLGYSLTGTRNSPAPPEATGLEVDKFSAKHVRAYLDEYLSRFSAATGPDLIGRRGLQNLLSDSWEAGVQNWTDDMAREFKARRGYDLAPWLPVLTGRIVVSAEASDRFLWDWRRTLQDLLAQHYQVLHDELTKRGMGFYAEAQGDTWRAIGDGMEMKSRSDIPMAEYWFKTFAAGPGQPSLKADMKESASVAHLYGRPLVANESLTVFGGMTPWSYSPAALKPVIDEIFAYGVNRFVLHTSVHQPTDKAPGLALGPFGEYINRHETWAEQAGPFFRYIARASYLLQQGRYVADVAYFYGEERPVVSLFTGGYDAANDRLRIEVPPGYGYDFINAETLAKKTSIADGQLATESGMRYRVLVIRSDVDRMSLATLERLAKLVDQGLVLVGPKPRASLGLGTDDKKFADLVAKLWGDGTGPQSVGKGRVYPGSSLADALSRENVAPDVVFSAGGGRMLQLHRRTDGGDDIYYVVNRNEAAVFTDASFRVTAGVPMRWNAETGAVEPISYRVEAGRVVVPLTLAKSDSAFIVFRRGTPLARFDAPVFRTSSLATLGGPWPVSFQAGRGAPASVILPQLESWTEATDDGVRHFSGTATYRRTLNVPAGWLKPNRQIMLDLGSVHEVASVFVNGKLIGIVWKSPYSVDVTSALTQGNNRIEVQVSNLWANRLIGDAAAKPGQPTYTWTAGNIPTSTSPLSKMGWSGSSPLLPSGILGPVRIMAIDPQ